LMGRLQKEFKPHRVVLCLLDDFLKPACLTERVAASRYRPY
jgi:hypothetical protein